MNLSGSAVATDQAPPFEPPTPGPTWLGRDREFAILALLFVSFRLAAVLFLRSGGYVYQGDHDFLFYRDVGELSLSGYYPYLDYWMEYPPLAAWAIVGVYRLSLLLPSWPDSLLWFHTFLATLSAIFDVGNLFLVYRIAEILHGRTVGHRAAWIYALLFLPLYALISWIDSTAVFFLLLTTWLALRGRPAAAGAAAGLGMLTKVIPAVAVPAAFFGFESFPRRLKYVAAFTLVVAIIAGPLLVANPTMFLASAREIVSRASWETIWALLEGYYGPGLVPYLASRFDPSVATWQSHPGSLPKWPMTGAFLIGCLLLYTRRLAWHKPGVAVPAIALTVNLLLIFSTGFSPQYLLYPLVLLIVVWPTARGAAYAVLLTADDLLEWPFAIGYFGSDHGMAWLVILTRTVLLIWLSVEYGGLLFGGPAGRWARLRDRLRWLVVAGASAAVIAGIGLTFHHYFERTHPDDASSVGEYLTAFSAPDQAAIAASRDAFYQIRPRIAVDHWMLAEQDEGQWPKELPARVNDLSNGRSRVWLIVDQALANGAEGDRVAAQLDGWGSRATDTWFGRFHLLGYLSYAAGGPGPRLAAPEVFGGALDLVGYDLTPATLTPGLGLSVTLDFVTRVSVTKDYKIFIHLADAQGTIVVQRDQPLLHAGRSSATWQVGEAVRQGNDLLVPATMPCGDYVVLVGLYDPVTGQRLLITSGRVPGDDKVVLAHLTACASGT